MMQKRRYIHKEDLIRTLRGLREQAEAAMKMSKRNAGIGSTKPGAAKELRAALAEAQKKIDPSHFPVLDECLRRTGKQSYTSLVESELPDVVKF